MMRFVSTKVELAAALGISRPTLDRLFSATQILECSMMGDTMFASGNDAHLSTFNRGSEGSVTDD